MRKTKILKSRLRLICVNSTTSASSISTAVNIHLFSVESALRTSITWTSALWLTSMKLRKWEYYRRKTRLRTSLNLPSAQMELAIVTSNTPPHYLNLTTRNFSSYFTKAAQQSKKNPFRKNFSKSPHRHWTVYRVIRTSKNNLSKGL